MRLKRSFSLLEIVVVFALLATIVSIAGIKTYQAVENTRFQESYKLLCDKIALARRLAKSTQGGISLNLEKMTIFLDGEALPNLKIRNLLRIKNELPGIANITLESAEVNTKLPILLTFYPNGTCALDTTNLHEATLKVTSSAGNDSLRKIEISQVLDDTLISESRDLYPNVQKEDS